jgi:hypothetical protein
MKTVLFFWTSILFPGLFWTSAGEGGNMEAVPVGKEYKGTAQTVIRYYDYNALTGQDVFIEEKSYKYNVFVFINPPRKTGSISESNPFNLQIKSDRTIRQDEEGHIDLNSGDIILTISGEVLLQHWNLTLKGSQINGILTDNHINEASAANLIWAWKDMAGFKTTVPYTMAKGTVMTGTVSANAVSIKLTGQSEDTYLKFTCQINATLK